MEHDSIKNRLNKAMAIRNIKPAELSRKTGISKSSLSEYTNGTHEPKRATIFMLSEALNISPVWLLGFDVPMEKHSDILENKLLQLDKYIEENNLDKIALIPVYDKIDITLNWKEKTTGFSPFDFKTQNCSENKSYFYYKISDNSMNIEKDTYILIEDTEDINVNDIILYSLNSKIDLGIYQLSLKKEKDFKILGKYIK